MNNYGRGVCPSCGGVQALRKDQTLVLHGECPGSWKAPVPGVTPRAMRPDPRPNRDGEHWSKRALCTDVDPDIFFDTDTRLAKSICRQCPVQSECASDGIGLGAEFGIWGGMSDKGRRNVRRSVRRNR